MFSPLVFVSAGAANSGVSGDPDVDLSAQVVDTNLCDRTADSQCFGMSGYTADNLSTGVTPI